MLFSTFNDIFGVRNLLPCICWAPNRDLNWILSNIFQDSFNNNFRSSFESQTWFKSNKYKILTSLWKWVKTVNYMSNRYSYSQMISTFNRLFSYIGQKQEDFLDRDNRDCLLFPLIGNQTFAHLPFPKELIPFNLPAIFHSLISYFRYLDIWTSKIS